jgi:hypothetical protein
MKLHVVNRGRNGVAMMKDGKFVDSLCGEGFRMFMRGTNVKLEKNALYAVGIDGIARRSRQMSVTVQVQRSIYVSQFVDDERSFRADTARSYVVRTDTPVAVSYPVPYFLRFTLTGPGFQRITFKKVARPSKKLLREAGVL